MYKKIKIDKDKGQLSIRVYILGIFRANFKGRIYDKDQITELESFKSDNSNPDFTKILKEKSSYYITKFLELRTLFSINNIDTDDDLMATIGLEIYQDNKLVEKIEDKYIPREGQRYHLLLIEFI